MRFAFVVNGLTILMLIFAFTAMRPADSAQVAVYYSNLLGFLLNPTFVAIAAVINIGPYLWPKRR